MKGLTDFIKSYKGDKKSKSMFPDDNIDPAKKAEMMYYVKCMEFLFTQGCNGNLYGSGILSGTENSIMAESRAYAIGQVPIQKYIDVLYSKKKKSDGDSDGDTKAYSNISFRQDQGHVKVRDQILGNYEKLDFDITVKAIDPASSWSKELEKAGMKVWLNEQWKSIINTTKVGMPGQQNQMPFENESDVDMYTETGGLKLSTEISMQKAINATKQHSKFRVLKSMLYADVVDLGLVISKDFIDTTTQTPDIRYVDPYYALIPPSKYDDFRDITMAGELRCMKISDIRKESNLKEKDLIKIAIKWGFNANGMRSEGEAVNEYGIYPYDHIEVYVLDGAWLSADTQVYLSWKHPKYGNLTYEQKNFDYEISESGKKKGKIKDVKRIQYTYKCKWIIGTDFAIDYGKDYFQPRSGDEGNKKARLPFHVHRVQGSPKMDRVKPYVDDINISTFKCRNAIAALPAPPGIIINKSALEDVDFDGEHKTVPELWDLFLEKGVLTIDTKDEFGNTIHNISSVVTSFQTKLVELFNIYQQQIGEARRNVEIVLGWNDVASGTSENERRLKVEGEAKIEAANNALQPEHAAMRELIQNTFESVMLRWQEVVRIKDYKVKYAPIDGSAIEYISITKDLSTVQFGMKVELATTHQEKMMLLQDIQKLKDSRRDKGVGGISQDVYLFVYRLIMQGQLDLANLWVAKALEKQRKQDDESRQKAEAQNAEIQKQSAIVAQSEARKTLYFETKLEMIKKEQEFLNAAILEVLKSDLEDGRLDNEMAKTKIDSYMASMPQPTQAVDQLFQQMAV